MAVLSFAQSHDRPVVINERVQERHIRMTIASTLTDEPALARTRSLHVIVSPYNSCRHESRSALYRSKRWSAPFADSCLFAT
jgi:hypothetical protein